MSFFLHSSLEQTVASAGAKAGWTLVGTGFTNRGVRLKILQDQAKGNSGPLTGSFEILDVGDNQHSSLLTQLLGATTDAASVLALIRQAHRQCVNIANANILKVETN
jgi:hypothetical protein